MSDAKEKTLALLSSTSSVDMKTGGATTLYTVPVGKTCRISHVVVRDPSASMAGGSDYDFTQWKQTVTLVTLTTAGTDYIVITGDHLTTGINVKYQELAASATFQITVNTGTDAACTATIDVFGYLA